MCVRRVASTHILGRSLDGVHSPPPSNRYFMLRGDATRHCDDPSLTAADQQSSHYIATKASVNDVWGTITATKCVIRQPWLLRQKVGHERRSKCSH